MGGCTVFPADNPWNRDISGDPVDTQAMTNVMPQMHPTSKVHPDWGTFAEEYGIPITTGKGAAAVPITFTTSYGPNESDKLACASGGGDFCYPIPLDAKIEGGNGAAMTDDRHVLFLDTSGAPDHCVLYELYNAQNQSGPGWTCANGAIFKLDSDSLRPDGWTSADAAGLPIAPGLVRYDEVMAGAITHAIRFTLPESRNAFIHPATHAAGKDDATLPPMGMRLRLKASFDDSAITGAPKVITTAMKKYGIILADNGSAFYISGETNDGWAALADDLNTQLGKIHGSDFEIVQSGDVIPQPQ
jgi:hypothetical protein